LRTYFPSNAVAQVLPPSSDVCQSWRTEPSLVGVQLIFWVRATPGFCGCDVVESARRLIDLANEAGGRDKIKAQPGQELDTLTLAQLADWRKAAEPLYAEWAANVKKAGYDPDVVMKDLKDSLAKYNSLY